MMFDVDLNLIAIDNHSLCCISPFQVAFPWVHQWKLHPNLFLGNFHVKWCLCKSWMSWLSLQFAGSNFTMPYAEIGARAVLVYCCVGVGGGCFCCLRFWVWSYLWTGDDQFSSIITLRQYSIYYNYQLN